MRFSGQCLGPPTVSDNGQQRRVEDREAGPFAPSSMGDADLQQTIAKGMVRGFLV